MLQYFPVSAALEGRCAFVYAFAPGAGEMRLPALLPQLQIHLSGTIAYRLPGTEPVRSGSAVLVGSTNRFLDIETDADTMLMGIGFLPDGWRSILRMPADEATDRIVDAAALWPMSELERLRERMAFAPLPLAAALLDDFVRRRMTGPDPDPRTAVIDRWIAQAGGTSIDRLTSALDLSLRQVERLTRATHGATPRLLELKYRTLRAASEMAVADATLSATQFASNFYDQSHLIHNFNRFVGTTPRRFHAEQCFLARQLLIGRWQAGARSPLSLWS
jgi:AraC-like DNA-binding protein